MSRIAVISLLSLAIAAPLVPRPAWAQGANPAQLVTPGIGTPKNRGSSGPREAPPPALPGARAEPTSVAPATKGSLDMPPTEALFDAINRGDLATAKDAVNRGADLNGVNVLGLTPIELAVDLGRNQISFYLLSQRGGLAGSTPSGPQAQARPPTRAERLAADRAERAERAKATAAARSRSAVADARPAAPQTARLFSNDGGAPVPQAGFLGFDAVR